MEFTSSDRVALLKCYGAVEGDTVSTTRAARQLADDLRQLEDAADVTTYELCDEDCRNVIGRISRRLFAVWGAMAGSSALSVPHSTGLPSGRRRTARTT